MVHAYVLIQTEVGKAAPSSRRSAPSPVSTPPTTSPAPYDVILKASAEDVDQLGKLVVARVQAIDGITRTLTCPVVNL